MEIFFLLYQNCASMWSPYRGETLRLAEILAFFVASVASKQMKTQDWNINHIKRMYGFSPVWLSSFGLSPVCVIKWLRKRLDWDDAYSHKLHICFTFSTVHFKCVVKSPCHEKSKVTLVAFVWVSNAPSNCLPKWMQSRTHYIFYSSSLCVVKCMLKPSARVNA